MGTMGVMLLHLAALSLGVLADLTPLPALLHNPLPALHPPGS